MAEALRLTPLKHLVYPAAGSEDRFWEGGPLTFIFVDHVLELEHGRSIVAEYSPSVTDPYFAHHFPRLPVMPASLVLEAFAQTATILLETTHAFRMKAVPVYIEHAKFRRAIRPGSVLELRMTMDQQSADGAVLTGTATQEKERRASVRIGMALTPLTRFYAPEHAEEYRGFYRRWFTHTTFRGFEDSPLMRLERALDGDAGA